MEAIVAQGREIWRSRPIEVRQAFMAKELLVIHPDLKAIHTTIRELQEDCAIEGKGKGLLVLANSGMGKTHLGTYFYNKFPASHPIGGNSIIPVVWVKTPGQPSRQQLIKALARALGEPATKREEPDVMFDRICEIIEQVGVQKIFIDNVQDVPDRRGVEVVKGIGNFFRDLVERSKCLVIFLGTPAAEEIGLINPQMQRRIYKRRMRVFGVQTPNEKVVFCRLLDKFDAMLPLAEDSGLGESKLAESICYATHGVIDYIVDLLIQAMKHACNCGRERITVEDLAAGFTKRYGHQSDVHNPFLKDGPQRLLDRLGEPFYGYFNSANPAEYEPRKPKKSSKNA